MDESGIYSHGEHPNSVIKRGKATFLFKLILDLWTTLQNCSNISVVWNYKS